jgi:hypothetical protein
MNEIEILKKRIEYLEFKLNEFVKPSKYLFPRDIELATGKIISSSVAITTGEADGVNVGAGTALTHTATFTGDNGSTAYTISDVIKHLKNLGLLTK